MSRVLTNAQLTAMGARRKDGSAVEPLAAQPEPVETPVPEAPERPALVESVKIDTSPIAEAVERLASANAAAMQPVANALEALLARADVKEPEPKPQEWEFTMHRDAFRNLTKVTAKEIQ